MSQSINCLFMQQLYFGTFPSKNTFPKSNHQSQSPPIPSIPSTAASQVLCVFSPKYAIEAASGRFYVLINSSHFATKIHHPTNHSQGRCPISHNVPVPKLRSRPVPFAIYFKSCYRITPGSPPKRMAGQPITLSGAQMEITSTASLEGQWR